MTDRRLTKEHKRWKGIINSRTLSFSEKLDKIHRVETHELLTVKDY